MNTINPETLKDFMNLRSSCRSYDSKPVNRAILEDIIETACLAPSGQNRQPWDFHVITSKKIILEIGELVNKKLEKISQTLEMEKEGKDFFNKYSAFFSFFEKAPVLVLVYAKKYNNLLKMLANDEDSGKIDQFIYDDTTHIQSASAAVMQMLLAAETHGLGACWNTNIMIAEKEISNYLNIRPVWSLMCLVSLGWPTLTEAVDDQNKPLKKRHAVKRVCKFYE